MQAESVFHVPTKRAYAPPGLKPNTPTHFIPPTKPLNNPLITLFLGDNLLEISISTVPQHLLSSVPWLFAGVRVRDEEGLGVGERGGVSWSRSIQWREEISEGWRSGSGE